MANSRARQDRLERGLPLAIKLLRIDAVKHREIPRELPQSLSQLQLRSGRVALLMMIEANREVDQRLQEEPLDALSWAPYILERLVALVELLRVEQLYAAPPR